MAIVTNDHTFLSSIDYTPVNRSNVDNGYVCNFNTLKNTYNHLSTFMPEFYFVQVRNGTLTTKLHIKPNCFYNLQMEDVQPVADTPHPTTWFCLPGKPVQFTNTHIVRCNPKPWFEMIDKMCNETLVKDIDAFINPYNQLCMRKDRNPPFMPSNALCANPDNKYIPIISACKSHPDYCDVSVIGPDQRSNSQKPIAYKASADGRVAWVGTMSEDRTFALLDCQTTVDVYNLNMCTSRTFDPVTRTLQDAPKCALKCIDSDIVIECQYLLHISDTDDNDNLMAKMGKLQQLVLIPAGVETTLKLVKYKHFVPLKADMSDLIDVLKWCTNNPDKCAKIIANAKQYADGLDIPYAMGKMLNSIHVNSCATNIGDVMHSMLTWEKAFFNSRKHREASTWKDYPSGNLNNIPMNPMSEAFARGCSELLTHPKFSMTDHARSLSNGVNSCDVADTEKVCEKLYETVNGLKFITRKYSSTKYMLHDFATGTLALNHLRKDIANFQYVYGNQGYQTMLEYLDGPTLAQWLQSSDFAWKPLTNILLQIIFALHHAYNMSCFTHYELTVHNIVLVECHVPQYYWYNNQLYELPPCGFRAVIQRFGSSKCSVYRQGHGGVTTHQMFDMFNPYHRPCIDVVTLMTSVFQTLSDYGVDIDRASPDYIDRFFGERPCFRARYSFGLMWRHVPSHMKLSDYISHVLSLNNVALRVVNSTMILPTESGYYKHVVNHCKPMCDPWQLTLKQLQETSVTANHSNEMLMDYKRTCVYIRQIFSFVDVHIPDCHRHKWEYAIKPNIMHRLSQCQTKAPRYIQKKDEMYKFLTEPITELKTPGATNWLNCVHHLHRLNRVASQSFCILEIYGTVDVGQLIHEISQYNMLKLYS
ncbi:putative kinase [Scale drop disease virus]|uniref:ORF_O37R n=1 Tax=Scale drop disease virus TaxID=1697349 RepID=A0A0K1L662_9VIRU|nr:ORF_O37R [Scale drop disease virus]AKU37452.1 ORF_O37R [Scale drop disease virus]QLI60710.1 putative kinase [Scale drop disease virus]QXJ13628.1 ORFO37R [Scale drop disease virus]UNH60745.1 putative kinase [Scale drop disease virus]